MTYTTTSQDKTVIFYDAHSKVLSEIELGKKRLTKSVKNSQLRAECIKVIESLVKHDSYGTHINNYTRIREYRKILLVRFAWLKIEHVKITNIKNTE